MKNQWDNCHATSLRIDSVKASSSSIPLLCFPTQLLDTGRLGPVKSACEHIKACKSFVTLYGSYYFVLSMFGKLSTLAGIIVLLVLVRGHSRLSEAKVVSIHSYLSDRGSYLIYKKLTSRLPRALFRCTMDLSIRPTSHQTRWYRIEKNLYWPALLNYLEICWAL